MSALSNLYHSAVHVVAQPIGGVAKAAGALTGNKQLTNLGHNITNPNVALSNPGGILSSSNPAFTGPGAYGHPVPHLTASGHSPQTSAQLAYDPYGNVAGGGGAGGAAGAYGSAAMQNEVRSRIAAIQGAYQSLLGNYDRVANDQVNQYNQNYDTQIKGLNQSYGDTNNQTSGVYGANGVGASSFLGNALDSNKNVYNTNLDSINQDRTSKLASIGQYVGGQKAQANAAMQQYNQYLPNVGQYSSADLQNLDNQLGSALPQIQAQSAGLGTNQDYINQLAQYAPAVNQGASQLQSKLQQLLKSSVPQSAQNTIAQGLIKSTPGADPAYYQDYYQKLLSGQGA